MSKSLATVLLQPDCAFGALRLWKVVFELDLFVRYFPLPMLTLKVRITPKLIAQSTLSVLRLEGGSLHTGIHSQNKILHSLACTDNYAWSNVVVHITF